MLVKFQVTLSYIASSVTSDGISTKVDKNQVIVSLTIADWKVMHATLSSSNNA